MPYAPINASASGDNTVVAAVSGRKIRVQNYTAVAAASVSVTWKSGANLISGAMPFAANGGAAPAAGGPNANGSDGILECNLGEALIMNLSGAVLVAGHVKYELI